MEVNVQGIYSTAPDAEKNKEYCSSAAPVIFKHIEVINENPYDTAVNHCLAIGELGIKRVQWNLDRIKELAKSRG